MNDEPAIQRDPGFVHRSSFIVHRLIAALWFGTGACLLFLAAPAAFRAAGNPTTAASVVGAMLTRWHYVALAAPIFLLILGWKSARGALIALLFAAIVFASAQAVVDTRIRSLRMSSPVSISSLPREHPVRKRFGVMHGISSILLLAQVLTAGAVVALRERA